MYWIERAGEFTFIGPTRGLAGWIRKDLPKGLLANFICDPESVFNDPSLAFLKKKPKAQVIKQTLRVGDGRTWNVIIKRACYGSLWRRFGFLFFSSPAVRSLENALMLKGWGICTPSPLAALECRDWRHIGTSYYLTEEVEGSQSLPTLWLDAPSSFSREDIFREKRQILKSLAFLFHQLHSRGIYHQDLKGGNILIRKSGSEKWQCYLIDIDGVWKCGRLSWFRRIKNLVQLYRTFGEHLNVKEKALFFKYYSDLFYLRRDRRKAIAGKVLSMNESWGEASLFKRGIRSVEHRTQEMGEGRLWTRRWGR